MSETQRHIIPVADLRLHRFSHRCWCHPRLRDMTGDGVYAFQHNAGLRSEPVIVGGLLAAKDWKLWSVDPQAEDRLVPANAIIS